ncbi:MAG: class I SAM-dependent methyltransferase [Candidatus Krumholzibacteriia bacterium]
MSPLPLPDWFFDLFEGLPQQGPGDDESSRRALRAIPGLPARPRILDVGSGPGRQTFVLARSTSGLVTAVDSHVPFLLELRSRSARRRGAPRIRLVAGDMANLPFPAGSFDLIWSEGSIYLMGLEEGLRAWRPLLRRGGHAAVSELTWLTDQRPADAVEFWNAEYPGMADVRENLRRARAAGYVVVDHFLLPPRSWWHGFYQPLQERIHERRRRWRDMPDAQALLRAVEQEIDLLRTHPHAYGYMFYVLRRK